MESKEKIQLEDIDLNEIEVGDKVIWDCSDKSPYYYFEEVIEEIGNGFIVTSGGVRNPMMKTLKKWIVLKEEETNCAKLRNQLSPFYNLSFMIKQKDDRLKDLIIKEAEQCEKNKIEIDKLLLLIERK